MKLSYKILRVINSAMYANRSRKIESIKEAVIRLGTDSVKFWVNLIALGEMSQENSDLLNTTLARANMCRCLATEKGEKEERIDAYFTVGLLSIIDALLNDDMAIVLSHLPLSDELNQALLNRKGELGIQLTNVIAYEQGKYDQINDSEISPPGYQSAYLDKSTMGQSDSQFIFSVETCMQTR